MHHVYECTFGFLAPLSCGATVAFGGGLSHFTRDMKQIRPTKLFAVPVLLEAIYNKLWAKLRESGFDGKVISAVKFNRVTRRFGLDLSKGLFSEIRSLFGGRLGLVIVGGGPISPDILMELREVGVKAVRLYGLTECSGLVTVNRDRYFRDSSEGLSTPSGIVDVYNVTEDGIGEIRYKGENIHAGILGEGSNPAVRDGWLYTGDLGHIDRDGFLYISGKKKNVFVTASGKNIFPEELEELLCRNPFISEAVVVGYVNEAREDYDIVAVLCPEISKFEEVYGKHYSRGQVDAEFNRAIDEVNRLSDPYKKIHFFVTRREGFNATSSRKVRRSQIADEARAEYLRKLART